MDAYIDQLWALLLAGCEILTSPGSARVHALGLIAGLLGASLYSARIGISMVQNEAEITRGAWGNNRKGVPKYFSGFLQKIIASISIYVTGLVGSLKGFLVSFGCGVLLPAVVLFTMVFAYPWFDPAGAHLADSLRQPIDGVGLRSALLFVADQTLRGGLFDLIEIFSIDVADISNNPANRPFSFGLFAYHLYVEAFVFSGLVLFAHNAWVLGRELAEEFLEHWRRFYG